MARTHIASLVKAKGGLIPLLVFSFGLSLAGVLVSLAESGGGWQSILSDSALLDSIGYSLWIAATSTTISLSVGLLLAIGVYRIRGPLNRLSQVYRIPLILPHITVGFIVLLLWTPSGIIPAALYRLGIVDDPQDLGFVLYSGSGWGIIIAYVLKELPFVMVLVLGALGQLDPRLETTARNLGAGKWQITREIYLPQAKGSLSTAGIIVFLYSFGAYEIPFIVGESYPSVVSVQVFRDLFQQDPTRRAEGYAFLVLLFVISIAMLIGWLKAAGRGPRHGRFW